MSVTEDRLLLLELATAWRHAMERAPLRSIPSLAAFPRGACGDASLLLGEHLAQSGLDAGEYVGARLTNVPQYSTHAWLEVRGFIVDITCDQFAHGPQVAVFVELESHWHRAMEEELRTSARLADYDTRSRAELTAWHDHVRAYLLESR